MKQFDFHRFATLLKWHLVGNRREILNVYFGLTVAFFAMMLFFTQVFGVNDVNLGDDAADWLYASRVHSAMGAGVFAVIATMVVGATRIFHNMKETRQRTTFLMLPASNAEKWLLRFLHATVLLFVVACLALVTADVVRMLIAPMWGKPFVSGVAWLLSGTGEEIDAAPSDGYGWFLLIIFSFVVLHHALFVLFGTLFRKNPFLLTCAVMFFLMLCFAHVAFWVKDAGWMQHAVFLRFDEMDGLVVPPLIWTATVVHYLLAAFFYWLSFRLFSRMQVINNKWLNV